jgi:hypothetical protein
MRERERERDAEKALLPSFQTPMVLQTGQTNTKPEGKRAIVVERIGQTSKHTVR